MYAHSFKGGKKNWHPKILRCAFFFFYGANNFTYRSTVNTHNIWTCKQLPPCCSDFCSDSSELTVEDEIQVSLEGMAPHALSFLRHYFHFFDGKSSQTMWAPWECVGAWELSWVGLTLLFCALPSSYEISSCRWEMRWPQHAVSPAGLKFN